MAHGYRELAAEDAPIAESMFEATAEVVLHDDTDARRLCRGSWSTAPTTGNNPTD